MGKKSKKTRPFLVPYWDKQSKCVMFWQQIKKTFTLPIEPVSFKQYGVQIKVLYGTNFMHVVCMLNWNAQGCPEKSKHVM